MEIIGYENYLIYEDGRVYNQKRNRFLKHGTTREGYKQVVLYKEGKAQNNRIHRLIALHYIPNPENKPCVDHINRIKTDNRIENLRWATVSENGQNQTKQINNKSGHIYVCYDKSSSLWKFSKTINKKRINKSFKSKIDCICYKFIIMLKIKTFENNEFIFKS